MKNSYDLERQLGDKYRTLLDYDKEEIDNPNKYHRVRLRYLDRIRPVISIIKREFPIPDQVKIGDFACAQGNTSLILAELGYQVFAVDIDQTAIEYSKEKYEKGKIKWFAGNIKNLYLPDNILNAAIAGELIEHCAYPEEIVEIILKYVRPGGLLILTTPNGSRINTDMPTFNQVFQKESRKRFETKQFGPGGKDHLFLFTLKEIKHIVPAGAKILESGYIGGTILINKYSQFFFKIFPIWLVEHGIRMLSGIPIINMKTFHNIYIILKKNSF